MNRSLTKGIVKRIEQIGKNSNPRLVRPMDGERIVFHLVSYHSTFHYDQDYGCKPRENDCDDCPYRFECFTIGNHNDDGSELIQIEFKGDTIGIFPRYWCTPEPARNELEAYLWGESNGRLQLRTARGGSWR